VKSLVASVRKQHASQTVRIAVQAVESRLIAS
jgi:hypothetical protein